MGRQNILAQLFDVRPVTRAGRIDRERMASAQVPVVDLRGKRHTPASFAPTVIRASRSAPPEGRVIETVLAVNPFRAPSKIPESLRLEVKPTASGVKKLPDVARRKPAHAPLKPAQDAFGAKAVLMAALADVEKRDAARLAELKRSPVVPQPEILLALSPFSGISQPKKKTERPGANRASRLNTKAVVAPSESPLLGTSVAAASRARVLPQSLPPRAVSEILAPAAPDPLSVRTVLASVKPRPRRVRTIAAVTAGTFFVFSALAGIGFLSRAREGFMAQGEGVFAAIETGVQALKTGQWREARGAFGEAETLIAAIAEKLDGFGFNAAVAAAETERESALLEAVMALARQSSELGTLVARAGETLFNADLWPAFFDNGSGGTALERLARTEGYLARAAQIVADMRATVGTFDQTNIGSPYRERLTALTDELPNIEAFIEEGLEMLPIARFALGDQREKRYLILLQNSSEMRPSGGFPGTYGLAKFTDGRLTTFFLDGVYNPDGQLTIEVAPPKVLQRVSPLWGMRDAGWFFDFPTSARKFAWFYEKAGGPAVDGVIALTPRFVERLLALTGPFAMPQYGQNRIDEDNFIEVLQYEVEADFDPKAGNPKKILTDLAPQFMERLKHLDPAASQDALAALTAGLRERDVQMFFFDERVQRPIDVHGWSGRIKDTGGRGDYLAVVHANVAGGKADWVTDDEILQEVSITADGGVTKSVSVTRRHRGGSTPYVWWNAPNKDYLRLLVPRGATLLAATGFVERDNFSRTPKNKSLTLDPDLVLMEGTLKHDPKRHVDTFREHDKDAFAGWLVIPAGESRSAAVHYALPGRLGADGLFPMYLQKQAGLKPVPVTTRLVFPETWRVTGTPESALFRPGLVEIRASLAEDLAYQFKFTRD